MTDSWTWDDVEGDVKPRTDTVDLCLDGTIQRKLEDAERELRLARRDDSLDGGASELQEQVDRLREQAAAATRTFEVVATSHRRWRELLTEHPSDDPGKRYNAETFIPAAFAECVVQFTSPEQVVKAQDMLTSGQMGKLLSSVISLNEGDDKVPLPRGR